MRRHHVRILEVGDRYIVLEKTGHKNETQELFELLKPYGVYQFVRSGLVAITKSGFEPVTELLKKRNRSLKYTRQRHKRKKV